MSTRSPLAELNVLKKICDHPRLLSTLACEQLGLDEQARFVLQFWSNLLPLLKKVPICTVKKGFRAGLM